MTADKPCTVLVVDDDNDIRETMVEILQDKGCAAIAAENGQAALQKLRDEGIKPCLILLDLMMPVMDGVGFRSEQQNDPALRDIPVVIISADRNLETTAKQLEVSAALKKPVSLKKLVEVVEGLCVKRSA